MAHRDLQTPFIGTSFSCLVLLAFILFLAPYTTFQLVRFLQEPIKASISRYLEVTFHKRISKTMLKEHEKLWQKIMSAVVFHFVEVTRYFEKVWERNWISEHTWWTKLTRLLRTPLREWCSCRTCLLPLLPWWWPKLVGGGVWSSRRSGPRTSSTCCDCRQLMTCGAAAKKERHFQNHSQLLA